MGLQRMNSDALHQVNIEIDEKGTVAAAATSIYVYKSLHLRLFNCNRPFLFIIHHKISKDVLFAGVYRGPDEN